MPVTAAVTENLGAEVHVYFTIDAPPAEHSFIANTASGHSGQSAEGDTVPALTGGKSLWTVRVAARSAVRPGQALELSVDTGKLHFFDPSSGDSIGPSADVPGLAARLARSAGAA